MLMAMGALPSFKEGAWRLLNMTDHVRNAS
jgi:hypothetical protein